METLTFFFVAAHGFGFEVDQTYTLTDREVFGCSTRSSFEEVAAEAYHSLQIGHFPAGKLQIVRAEVSAREVFGGFFSAMRGDTWKKVSIVVTGVYTLERLPGRK